MKNTALALAALLALSGSAFAGEAAKSDTAAPAACADTTLKAALDCKATGSIEKIRQDTASDGNHAKPRLGIDINPWIMPSTF